MRAATLTFLAVALSGCAPTTSKIAATYVPPSMFASASCEQLARDAERLQSELTRMGIAQDRTANADTHMVLTSLFLAWPAVFLVDGGKQVDNLARTKGEFVALRTAALDKGCITAEEAPDPRYAYTPPPLPKADDVGTAPVTRRSAGAGR